MSGPLRLILFDVDGTLADSQAAITGAMAAAFGGAGLAVPPREAILSIVGLSLPLAMRVLAPEQDAPVLDALVEGYKTAYMQAREAAGAGHTPLFPGAREVLAELNAVPEYLLGVATGKSARGFDALAASHGLDCFVTRQVADHHPSKPHPAMIEAAMAETGVDRASTVMIGDTRFDIEMGRAAGVTTIAVPWGYHPAETLGADFLIRSFAELRPLLANIWKA
ncbi:HAD-IA family hydrolase [Cribrihabitans pelagius]|uniref:HAD-IA family hydrolase n=1 Tax=Cribrihabitans pelagius TaxID=1765746 RepID=UPI003B5B8664